MNTEATPSQVLTLIDILLRSLGMRVVMILTLAMTFALFCWAMWKQTPLAFAVACAFGIGVLWPVLFVGWREGDKHDHS